MSIRMDALRAEHTQIVDKINGLEAAALERGTDLTEAERAESETLLARAKTLLPEIETEGKRSESIDAAAAILARHRPAAPIKERSAGRRVDTDAKAPTAGEFLNLVYRARQGDSDASELLLRAVDTQTTADTTGILPAPIIGPVIKLVDDRRLAFTSFTQRPMPGAGKTFSRPRVTQRTNVGEQSAELEELVSRNMTLVGDTVTKRTFGGVLELSEQDIDWTDPSALQIVIEDIAGVYANVTEAAACTALTALASATTVWTGTDIGTIVTSITTAIQTVYTAVKQMPDTCWLSLDEGLSLAGTTNADDSVTAMTLIKQALADAGVPMAFKTIPGLPADSRIVGCSNLVEAYEQQKGLISAPDVPHLGQVIAYRGYAAFYGVGAGFRRMVSA